jgi:ketosteroid isomerase-like protein
LGMSEENRRIVRDAIAALNRGGIEAFLNYFEPNVEWITPPDWLEDRVLYGHDGVRTAVAQFGEQLDEFRVDLERAIDLGGERVIALLYQRGRIKGTDHQLEQELGVIIDLRDGKATRVELYFSWQEALKAVGAEG